MKVMAVTGRRDVAEVFMADMGDGRMIEFVEALQPPYPREKRWILMVSTLYGCPVNCLICDAGGIYRGKPSAEEILRQIDHMVYRWYPNGQVPADKFKIQFARMGEPAFNLAVLEVLERLPTRYEAPGLMPSISTIAPHGAQSFFDGLLEVKERLYDNGRFQFQYSIHTTDVALRDRLIPVKKWSFSKLASFGERFYKSGDRKITLNFALAEGMPVDPGVLQRYFDPERYLVKITPVNPTCHALKNELSSLVDPYHPETGQAVAESLRQAGYEVILSIGEVEENQIGSNCGQYVLKYLEGQHSLPDGYSYQIKPLALPE